MPVPTGQLVNSYSVEDKARSVEPWEVNLRQVSQGPFHASMQATSLGDILVYRDCWSQRTLATGARGSDYFLLGCEARANSGIDWCGAGVDTQRLVLTGPETEVDFIIPAQSPYIAILLPVQWLVAQFGDEAVQHLRLPGLHHYPCNPVLGKRLITRLNWIIDTYQNTPCVGADPRAQQLAETCLVDDLAEMGFGQPFQPGRVRISARRQTLKRALEYGESVHDKISVPEFATQLAVSQRSLELAFQEFLGITPRQYLNNRRMHGVHSELQARAPDSRCVTQVANSWGFSELGRFAGEYKRLFGEVPTATLQREQACAPPSLRDLLH